MVIKTIILFLIMCLIALASTANAGFLAIDPTCAPLVANVHSCSDALRSGDPATVTPQCCDGLRAIETAESVLGARATCRCILQCLRAHFPQVLRPTSPSFTKLALTTDDVGTGITAMMKSQCDVDLTCL